MKRIICIMTTLMMVAAMVPYAVFAASNDVIEGEMGIEDNIFDKDDGEQDKPDEPTQPGDKEEPSQPNEPSDPSDPGDKEEPTDPSEPGQPDDPGAPDEPGDVCTHTYKLTGVEKASLSEDGERVWACELCGEAKSETISKIESVELIFPRVNYDGKVKKPEVVAVDGAGEVIDAGNYTVDYPKDIKKIGAYKVTVTFASDIYEGSRKLTFAVVRPAPKTAKIQLRTVTGGYDDVVFSWSKVPYAKGYKVYYKKASAKKYTLLKTIKTNKTTKITKKNLLDGVKYNFKVVSYVVIGGKQYESADQRVYSIYTLKKLAAPKVVKSGSKVKVSWTNIDGDTGYQISKATKKKGTNIVSTYKTTKGTYKKLTAKKGTKYYYKVRVYKTYKVGKKYVKVYGPWSAVKAYKR